MNHKIWKNLPKDIIKYIASYDKRFFVNKNNIKIGKVYEYILYYDSINPYKKLEFCYRKEINFVKNYKYFDNIYIKLIYLDNIDINNYVLEKSLIKINVNINNIFLQFIKFKNYLWIDKNEICIKLPINYFTYFKKFYDCKFIKIMLYIDQFNYHYVKTTKYDIRFF